MKLEQQLDDLKKHVIEIDKQIASIQAGISVIMMQLDEMNDRRDDSFQFNFDEINFN